MEIGIRAHFESLLRDRDSHTWEASHAGKVNFRANVQEGG